MTRYNVYATTRPDNEDDTEGELLVMANLESQDEAHAFIRRTTDNILQVRTLSGAPAYELALDSPEIRAVRNTLTHTMVVYSARVSLDAPAV